MESKKLNDQSVGILPNNVRAEKPFSDRITGEVFRNGQRRDVYADLRDFNGFDDTGDNDCTSTFQSALSELSVYTHGTLCVPPNSKTYKISGPLQTSVNGVNPNCQLYFPLQNVSDEMRTMRIVGDTKPNFSSEGVEAAPRNTRGCIIESTIQGTGTIPAVFGMPWANQGVTGLRNYITLMFENLIVRTSTKSGNTDIAGTMSAINLERACQAYLRNVKVDISSALTSSARPVNETYGLIMPAQGNKAELELAEVFFAEGYKYGLVPSEHIRADHIVIGGCENGIYTRDGIFTTSIQHLTVELNRQNILLNGPMKLNIFTYESEHFLMDGTKWFTYQTDIKKVGSTGKVNIVDSTILNSGGATGTFGTQGTPNYKILLGDGAN